MKRLQLAFIAGILFALWSCSSNDNMEKSEFPIQFISMAPGHFHASLVQKYSYDEVDSVVEVYGNSQSDIQAYLDAVKQYNARTEEPTNWNLEVYTGPDFEEKMIRDSDGNVVVLAGNNQLKTEYILNAVNNGKHVYADKPMAINVSDFDKLKQAFDKAKENELLIYDIMTERNEITSVIQKELSFIPELFGEFLPGTEEEPTIELSSVHHFFKYVSGNKLTRPLWFFDVEQEGEGMVDVMTHLVDLVQWQCYPEQIINYPEEINIISTKRWSTDLAMEQLSEVCNTDEVPDYLQKDIVDDTLRVYSNGEIIYQLRDITARTSVSWAYRAPEGTGDTHYAIVRGTKADIAIEQVFGDKNYRALYIYPKDPSSMNLEGLKELISPLRSNYVGIDVKEMGDKYEVVIPDALRTNHEEHFGEVTKHFIDYFQNGNMPEWEVPNMLAKYYTTTEALKMAREE